MLVLCLVLGGETFLTQCLKMNDTVILRITFCTILLVIKAEPSIQSL